MKKISLWLLIAAHVVVILRHVLEVLHHLPSGISQL